MRDIGYGIAIIGIWTGSALAIMWGAAPEIFVGSTIATIVIAVCNAR